MFVANITALFIIPCIESGLWKYIFLNHVNLYIVCGNLMVNAYQPHILQRQTQRKTGNVLISMTYWYRCVTIVGVEKQYVLHILSLCL